MDPRSRRSSEWKSWQIQKGALKDGGVLKRDRDTYDTHTRICIYIYVYIYMCIYIHTYTLYICINSLLYIYMYLHTYTYYYIYIYYIYSSSCQRTRSFLFLLMPRVTSFVFLVWNNCELPCWAPRSWGPREIVQHLQRSNICSIFNEATFATS